MPRINKALAAGVVPVDALSSDGLTTLSHGHLALVNNSVDQASGDIRMKATFANEDDVLWPGLSVSTRLLVDTLKEVIVVPADAVQRGPNGLYAYVVGDGNKVEMRDIKVAQEGDGLSVVSQGLSPGQNVVTEGQYRLQDGALAQPAPAAQTTSVRRQGALIMALNISEPFIRHPIATSLLMVGILFVGIVAYPNLPVAPLPQVDFPTLQVSAQLPGASPETMASSVAQPLETQFAQISGVSQMTSISTLGVDRDHPPVRPRAATSTGRRATCWRRSTPPAANCPRTCRPRRPFARSIRRIRPSCCSPRPPNRCR